MHETATTVLRNRAVDFELGIENARAAADHHRKNLAVAVARENSLLAELNNLADTLAEMGVYIGRVPKTFIKGESTAAA